MSASSGRATCCCCWRGASVTPSNCGLEGGEEQQDSEKRNMLKARCQGRKRLGHNRFPML